MDRTGLGDREQKRPFVPSIQMSSLAPAPGRDGRYALLRLNYRRELGQHVSDVSQFSGREKNGSNCDSKGWTLKQ